MLLKPMVPRFQEMWKPTQWTERRRVGLSGKLRKKESGSPLGVSESFAAGKVSMRHLLGKMDPKENGDTNASALKIGWLVDSWRNCTKRLMKLKKIMGRKMSI